MRVAKSSRSFREGAVTIDRFDGSSNCKMVVWGIGGLDSNRGTLFITIPFIRGGRLTSHFFNDFPPFDSWKYTECMMIG